MSDFLTSMNKLSSAEEFLDALKVGYDPQVVRVNRLHILKRFHDYLGQAGQPDEASGDAAMAAAYAEALAHAYNDFVVSTPHAEKVFKVFHQAEANNEGRFVGLSNIKRKGA